MPEEFDPTEWPYEGAGLCPAGFSPCGFGVFTSPEPPTSFGMFEQQDGTLPQGTEDTGYLHNGGMDVELDSFGRPFGDKALRSKIRLALTTVRGSALNPNLGLAAMPKTLGPADLSKLNVNIRQALKPMTDAGEMEIISLNVVNDGSGRATIRVEFRDLQANIVNTFNLPNSFT